jgi:hypothetical protein
VRGNARKFPDKREGRASAKGRLVQLLYGCTPEALARFTPERLHAMHNVPLPECVEALEQARQPRA